MPPAPRITGTPMYTSSRPYCPVRSADAGINLLKVLEIDQLVLTRSEKGMSIIDQSGKKLDVPTVVNEVADITGAGDTVVAALAVALNAGFDIEDAVHFANRAAGVVVSKLGTATATLAEIRDLDQMPSFT